MSVTALIDADVFAFQAAASTEEQHEWDPGHFTYNSSQELVISKVKSMIEQAQNETNADRVVIAMSCPTRRYWRHDIFPGYKAGRSANRTPLLLMETKKILEEEYESFVRPTLEADDILGILSTNPKLIPGEKIIVSVDKDMMTIPGAFHHWGDHETYDIEEPEADYWHMYQTLVGDSTDGYPGCPGVGPKGVYKIIGEPGDETPVSELWPEVLQAFKKKKLGEEEALRQAQLARILRHSDYDYKNRRPILWTP